MIFFIGVSLTLGSLVDILRNLSGEALPTYFTRTLADDYQQSHRFRSYISNRLENFLSMATAESSDASGYRNYHDYGYYYNGDGAVTESTETITSDIYQEALKRTLIQGTAASGYEFYDYYSGPYMDDYGYFDYDDYYYNYLYDYFEDYFGDESAGSRRTLTEEQKNELQQKTAELRGQAAQNYHDRIKGDKNILYTILYDGKVLYTNAENLPADGSMTAPEGYNFVLYFADGNARILKDGKEVEIYGDGYYREESEWYVPGYRNFQADEEMKKVTVCLAAVKEPVLYTEGRSGEYRAQDNSLYWMRYESCESRKRLLAGMESLALGLLFLFLSLFVRRAKREADQKIARFTGMLWAECKAALVLITVVLIFADYYVNGYGYALWQEIRWAYESGWQHAAAFYARSLLRDLSALHWTICFWEIYLIVNDLKYNQKVWRHSLTHKLYRTFTAKELHLPLSRRMAHRNTAVLLLAGVYGLFLLSGTFVLHNTRHPAAWMVLLLLYCLMTAGFFLAEYLICAKNVETAHDLEILSDRIGDIRNGNYTPSGEDAVPGDSQNRPVGQDLAQIMAQLEDIRHGMAVAVDEQMKSERMKVELIANVSHDLKTPLTSIISYVQFLKEEESLPDHVKDYVMILDEKSQRLKNMVQDVFAVSKAASGELPMHMEELDFGKLLRQTMAEMEEQISASSLTFRTEIPDAPVMILADGQRLYRVFQNLFQNALQYSLDSSRVYVTLTADQTTAAATIQNTSLTELKKGMDFTERFARGDQSRTDGGSGLGLSIAKTFTEACGGQFDLEVNADLFTVTVSFRLR